MGTALTRRVSVVLTTWNSAPYMPRCLAGIAGQDYPDVELIAVDNASIDGTPALIRAAFPTCTQIVNDDNYGFTVAVNRGVAASTGEFVLLWNPDAWLAPDYISTIVAAFDAAGEAFGMATGKLLHGEGIDITPTNLIDTKGIRMTRSGRHFDIGQGEVDGSEELVGVRVVGAQLTGGRVDGLTGHSGVSMDGHAGVDESMSGWGRRSEGSATATRQLGHVATEHSATATRQPGNAATIHPPPTTHRPSDPATNPPTAPPTLYEVFGVSGAAAIYRRSFIDDVKVDGQFLDEDFFTYREDADVAWRGRVFGWRALYVPAAVGYHVRTVTPQARRSLSPIVNMHSVKNRFLLRLKNEGLYLALRNAPFELPRDLVAIGAILTVERSSLPALRWLWKNRRRIMAKRRDIQRRRRVSDRALADWFR